MKYAISFLLIRASEIREGIEIRKYRKHEPMIQRFTSRGQKEVADKAYKDLHRGNEDGLQRSIAIC